MLPAVRVGLVVLGTAMAVYGVASLTGGSLGTPPWWERANDPAPLPPRGQPVGDDEVRQVVVTRGPVRDDEYDVEVPRWQPTVPRHHREWISGGAIAAGLALTIGGAWRRRRSATPADAR